MKKIESEMLNAWNENRAWTGGNTTVSVEWDPTINEPMVRVILFGNVIAKKWVGANGSEWKGWTLAGWNTPTTRSRLNALGVPVRRVKGKTMAWGRVVEGVQTWQQWSKSE